MSHQAFWDALHAAKVRMVARETADRDLADERDNDLRDLPGMWDRSDLIGGLTDNLLPGDRDDDIGDELADREDR